MCSATSQINCSFLSWKTVDLLFIVLFFFLFLFFFVSLIAFDFPGSRQSETYFRNITSLFEKKIEFNAAVLSFL